MIYVDVDGVLADFNGRILTNYNAKHGTKWTNDDVTDWEYQTIFHAGQRWQDYIDPGFWLDLELLPWAQRLVKAVRDTRQNYAFLTYIPDETADRRHWLNWHFTKELGDPPGDRMIIAKRKELVVHSNDLLIDDAPRNIKAVRKNGATVMALAQPWNQSVWGRMSPEQVIQNLERYKR